MFIKLTSSVFMLPANWSKGCVYIELCELKSEEHQVEFRFRNHFYVTLRQAKYILFRCLSFQWDVRFYALQKKTIFNLYVRYSYSSHVSWPFWILFKEISSPPELSNLVGTATHLFLFCFINLLGNIHINVYALSVPYKVLPLYIVDSSWTPAVKFIMSFLVSLHNVSGLEQVWYDRNVVQLDS